MKKQTISVVFIAIASFSCSKSESGGGGAAAGGGGGGGGTTLTLAKVANAKIDVPEGSTAGDGIGAGAMIQGPNLVVNVELASSSRPKTVDDAKKDADMYSPKNLKAEKLADGWLLTYDNEGGMGKNYFVQVRRELAGKSVWCETTSSSPEQQANAVKACKTLRF